MRSTPVSASYSKSIGVALLAPACAVAFVEIFGHDNLAAATALCLLAVVVAAAVAGRTSGLLASIVSFLGLNFFFTQPRHTFLIHEPADLIAVFVFLLCGVIVGTLLSRTLEERERAERRATEAQILSRSAARLMVADSEEAILEELSSKLLEMFELTRCEISTVRSTGIASGGTDNSAGPSVTIPLTTPTGQIGSITVARDRDGEQFSVSELELLETLASQSALAMERAALDRQVRDVTLEAESSALRAALFSSVTHDLKTPLASIKASATGLLAPGAVHTKDQRDEVARTIIEATDHLNQIVANLLDLARMRAGVLIPNKQTVFIEDAIAAVVRRMARQLDAFDLEMKVRPDLPPVEADPIQIEQVISNLLENAVRFSPQGTEIQIAAALWHDDVQVRVTDHGPGIPAEDRERVFEEFFSRGSDSARPGTGLGLAIARAVVIGHGGKIWAAEAAGGGTSIIFELPVVRTASGALEQGDAQAPVTS